MSLANNHALDYGAKALLDTLERLDKVGVAYAGAGADRGAAEAPALLITPAGIVKVLAFTEIIPGGFAATSEYPGVNATTHSTVSAYRPPSRLQRRRRISSR